MQKNIEAAIARKIISLEAAVQQTKELKNSGKKIVFTNGVFDILHAGHIRSLAQAAACGDFLIVGLNADSSVKRLKGNARPIIPQAERAFLLAALFFVYAIVLFEEDTPVKLISAILPDVLVKSADYKPENIAGAKEVIANGGEVKIMPFVEGLSSTTIIEKIKQSED